MRQLPLRSHPRRCDGRKSRDAQADEVKSTHARILVCLTTAQNLTPCIPTLHIGQLVTSQKCVVQES
jgi:hypothetical protein